MARCAGRKRRYFSFMHLRRPLFLCLVACAAHAQGQVHVEGHVRDATTGEPLPFASVVAHHAGTSTLTNEEGAFRIGLAADDTLIVSYLGYQHQRVAAHAAADIRLQPSTLELRAVEIDGRSDPLYELVVRSARHLDRAGRYRSKLYYELGTRTDGRPVEALECFYNAELKGPGIASLALKNGRIAVVPDKGRYMLNLNTSKGFTLLHPTRKGPFPTSPLEAGSVSALRKRFDLTLLGITHDPEELYHILLVPRDSTADLFRAELWLEPTAERIRSLTLECTDCGSHPFQALYPSAQLRNMDIRYRQTYTQVDGRQRLQTIELDYALTYHPRFAGPNAGPPQDRRVYAKGIMHLFDHGKSFILPLFRYDRDQTDYRKITFMPYDSVFWANAPTLPRTAQQERDQALFQQKGTLLGHGLRSADGSPTPLFDSNYTFWSPARRISLKSHVAPPLDIPVRGGYTTAPPPMARQVELVTQLYLNIDSTATGYRTFSVTVFDGLHSLYQAPPGPHTDLFLNLFFDLCEIERRRMQAALDTPGLTLERIKALHSSAEAAMADTTLRFMKETRYGEDMRALQRWNEHVRDRLGIDNAALFGAEAERP